MRLQPTSLVATDRQWRRGRAPFPPSARTTTVLPSPWRRRTSASSASVPSAAQPGAPEQQRAAIDAGNDALPGKAEKSVTAGSARPVARASTGFRQRMFGALFERRGGAAPCRPAQPATRCRLPRPLRQRAGLVDGEHADVLGAFERLGILDQDAGTRPARYQP